jgi:hypothetical protein
VSSWQRSPIAFLFKGLSVQVHGAMSSRSVCVSVHVSTHRPCNKDTAPFVACEQHVGGNGEGAGSVMTAAQMMSYK